MNAWGVKMRISLEHFLQSEKATELGIDNTPTEEARKNIEQIMIPLTQEIIDLGCSLWFKPFPADPINSGYRCDKLNNAIRGSATSAHRAGLAVDIATANGVTVVELFNAVVKSPKIMKRIDQLILERGCLHVGCRIGEPRHELRGEAFVTDAITGKVTRTYPLIRIWSES